jgi:hypothetical protein
MTELTKEHFELHDKNKAKIHEDKKKKKITSWAIVVTIERSNGTWYDETITEIDDDTASSVDTFLTEYIEEKNKEDKQDEIAMKLVKTWQDEIAMKKYTKVEEINKNGCYYKKRTTQIFFDDGSTNHELMCVATDTINAKQIMTALNLVDKMRKGK